MDLQKYITDIPGWPIDGVMFKDITPLLAAPEAYKYAVDMMSAIVGDNGIDAIVSPDARGWLFACPIADRHTLPLHLVRKPGKLPPATVSKRYAYEYAEGTLEMKAWSFESGSYKRVAIIDDVNATGGTAMAIVEMLREKNVGEIHYISLIDLTFLGGTAKLEEAGVHCASIIKYD